MKLSDYLADFLVKEGISHVFQIIGGASVHMVHSIAQRKDITYIAVQHEQAGAMAADAYARLTKNIGAAMATSGPGMTNLITGIACAYFDSTPVLYITGQVNTDESRNGRKVRQIGFQETDIVDIVKPLTKFSAKLEAAEDIRYLLEKVFYISRSGRPGPVLIDIPLNFQRAQIEPRRLRKFDPSEIKVDIDTKKTIKDKITKAIALLRKAKRPVVIAGGAIRYADKVEEFNEFIRLLSFPVVATWSGIDVVWHDHPLYRGQTGVYGSRGTNFTVQNSDCIVSIGSRLDTRITGGRPETFGREAKKIVVDIDRAELYKDRGLTPDIGICGDVKEVLPLFISRLKKEKIQKVTDWLKKTKQWIEQYPKVLPQWRERNQLVNPYYFIEMLSQMLPKDTVTVTDCGGNLTWTIQAFRVKKGQRLFSAMGNSPMGYSFPASLGASIAMGKKPVICIIGDGGMQINIQELQTMVHYKIPVKLFILNSNSYAIIVQFQKEWFDSKFYGTIPENGYSAPDFTKIATAYNLPAIRIDSHKQLKSKIEKVLNHKGPIVCEVMVPHDSALIPKVSFGRPIEDQSPLLSRDEFKKNMLIKLVEN